MKLAPVLWLYFALAALPALADRPATVKLSGPALHEPAVIALQPELTLYSLMQAIAQPGFDYSRARLCRVQWDSNHNANRARLLADLDALYNELIDPASRQAIAALATRLQEDPSRACRFWPLDPDRLLALPRWNITLNNGDALWLAAKTDRISVEGLMANPLIMSSEHAKHTIGLKLDPRADAVNSDWALALVPQGGQRQIPIADWNGDRLNLPGGSRLLLLPSEQAERLAPGISARLIQYYRYQVDGAAF